MNDRDRMNADLYRAAFGRLGRWPTFNPNFRVMSDRERADRAAETARIRAKYNA